MNLLKKLILLFPIFLFFAEGTDVSASTMSSKRDCVVCHIMWAEGFRTDQESLIDFQPGNVLMKDTQGVVSSEEICYSCHDGYVMDSRHITGKFKRHPVFVKPSENVKIPDDLPLSVKGEIYCGTCHSAHGKGASSHNNTGGKTRLFREENIDSSLCEKCHRDEASYKSSNSHPLHSSDRELSDKLFTLGSKLSTEKNKIICETCHKVHGAEGEKILLIDNSSSDLCAICHEKQQSLISTKHDLRISLPDEKNIKELTPSESGPCSACHTLHNSKGEKLWAKPIEKGNPASQFCLSCHSEETGNNKKRVGKNSHPLDVAIPLDAEQPEGLPLFTDNGEKHKRGGVQCLTCHDSHRWDPVSPDIKGGKDVEGDSSNSFLRMSNTSSTICMECHSGKKQVLTSDHNLSITAPGEKNIHGLVPSASGPCGACHVPHNAAAKPLWAKELSGDRDYSARLCISCHQEKGPAKEKLAEGINHPMNVNLKKQDMTTGLPLFDSDGAKAFDGKIVCITCHDPHIWDPDRELIDYTYKNIEGDASNSFLRMSNISSALCTECHSSKKQVIESDHNLMITAPLEKNVQGAAAGVSGPCSSCHVPHNGKSKYLWARELSRNGDFMTQLCTSCHTENGPAKDKSMGGNNHPVDVTLEKLNITTDLPLFDDEGSKTVNGKILCLTCHDPHTWAPDKSASAYNHENIEGDASNSFLRVNNFPSPDLCSSCHKDKAFIDGTEHDLSVTAPEFKNLSGQTVKESGQCGACHLVHNSPNKLKLWARIYGNISDEEDIINSLCTSCHSSGRMAENKTPLISTHPGNTVVSNVLRSDRSKADFTPLYDKATGEEASSGNVSCPLCHNVHQWNPLVAEKGDHKNIEGNARNSFLRSVSYNNVCIDCHGFDALFRFKYFHDPDDRVEEINISNQ